MDASQLLRGRSVDASSDPALVHAHAGSHRRSRRGLLWLLLVVAAIGCVGHRSSNSTVSSEDAAPGAVGSARRDSLPGGRERSQELPRSFTGSEAAPDSLAPYVAVQAPTVALRHVGVIDGTGSSRRDDQTIVIEGDRITAVGPARKTRIPAGAEILDLKGHTVIPGIVGLHNHTFYTTAQRRAQLNFSSPRLYLASGVTTIRTTGSYCPYCELNLRRQIEARLVPGPRIHVTSPYLTGLDGSDQMSWLTSVEDARRVVGYWAEEGVTWFKAYTRIRREELRAVIEEAHRRGLKVTGHLCSVSFREAVGLGIDNLEHGLFTNTDWVPGKTPDVCPESLAEQLAGVDPEGEEVRSTISAMIDNDVALTSTLAIYELLVPGRPPLDERIRRVLAPEVLGEYLAIRDQLRAAADSASSVWPELFRRAQAFERAFYRSGGLLAAGVDPTGIGGALPGFGDQRNFELLVEAGFTPVEAIRIMTLNGARVLEEDKLYGSIEPGKLAELVVIEGDPAADPSAIRNVRLVFKDGLGFDSEKLIKSVEGVVGTR
jgi:imidazolonepropionase-like amidohydrolase